ncbi:unnamed protein product [Trichobilharzia szidati]|nr:unnamed protein product [Trichobilharzia szidati]
MSSNTSDNLELGSVSAISLTVPVFKPRDPHLWFARLEHYLASNKLTSQTAKFGILSTVLPDEVAEQVRQYIVHPSTEAPYDKLKEEVLRCTSLSDRQALDRLLSNVELGDKTPSQLMRHMQSLVAGREIDKRLFYQIWLRRLPQNIQQVLAFGDDDIDIERLTEIADRMYERSTPQSVASTSRIPDKVITIDPLNKAEAIRVDKTSNERIEALERKIDVLTEQLMAMRVNRQPTTTYRRQRSHSRNRRKYSLQQNICWYHRKFGVHAKRCTQPCAFQQTVALGNEKAGGR